MRIFITENSSLGKVNIAHILCLNGELLFVALTYCHRVQIVETSVFAVTCGNMRQRICSHSVFILQLDVEQMR